jgi:hypothetical protein
VNDGAIMCLRALHLAGIMIDVRNDEVGPGGGDLA